MIAWLLAKPLVLLGLGAVLVLGVRETQHFFTIRSLRGDITRLEMVLDQERTAAAAFKVALATVESNRATLESIIREMNARLDTLQARARQVEAAANLRVARALRAGEAQAAALRAETTRVPPGHAAMNQWLTERIGS